MESSGKPKASYTAERTPPARELASRSESGHRDGDDFPPALTTTQCPPLTDVETAFPMATYLEAFYTLCFSASILQLVLTDGMECPLDSANIRTKLCTRSNAAIHSFP